MHFKLQKVLLNCVVYLNSKQYSQQMERNFMSKLNANIPSLCPQQQLDLQSSTRSMAISAHQHTNHTLLTLLLVVSYTSYCTNNTFLNRYLRQQ